MKQTRYRYTKKPLFHEEALARKRAWMARTKAEILRRESQLADAEEEFLRARTSPLETEVEVQEAVEPGEPGYEDLPDVFDSGRYQGDVRWINLPAGPLDSSSTPPSTADAPAPPDQG